MSFRLEEQIIGQNKCLRPDSALHLDAKKNPQS
jgi:hypothetical protein